MAKRVKWGILGTGQIARKFAKDLKLIIDAELIAVGSRTESSANEFGDLFNVPRRYDSYEALVKDPDVEVIYIATPHPFHHDNSLLCLSEGKAVLCEKPFTINAKEAEEVISVAKDKNIFLMEAMWSRFIPMYGKLKEWIKAGRIGDVRMITADFGYRSDFDPDSRIFNPELGGGALLDVGIYPIDFATWIMDQLPKEIRSWAEIGETGIDEQSAYIFGYENGEMALLNSAVRTETPHDAIIMGTEGQIKVHAPFWNSRKATITDSGEETTIDVPIEEGHGFLFEAEEVMRCLRDGKTQSDRMTWEGTLHHMQLMDTIRKQWGMKYPGE